MVYLLFIPVSNSIYYHEDNADLELKYTSREYNWLKVIFVRRIKKSRILDDIIMPIGNRSTEKGYMRAMMGYNELNIAELEAGCIEEITQKGEHLIESQILMAYLHTACTILHPACLKDVDILRGIATSKDTPAKLYNSVQLCLANTLMESHRHSLKNPPPSYAGTSRQNFFKQAVNELNKIEKFCAREKIFIIKSGVLIDGILYKPNDEFIRNLKVVCKLMPDFCYAHWQLFYAELKSKGVLARCDELMRRQEKLFRRFPHSIELRGNYVIKLFAIGQGDKALQELNNMRRDNPDRIDDTWWIQGRINMGKPISVLCLKRAIMHTPSQMEFYEQLVEYFESTTHEYGKALEVINMALDKVDSVGFYGTFFELRQKLLLRIESQNFWDKL